MLVAEVSARMRIRLCFLAWNYARLSSRPLHREAVREPGSGEANHRRRRVPDPG
ncbi:MAG: hypothetical protein JO273_25575 [Methylobacteriaceae bacterium]|nr:hypothetical protein [Methylobacteriaceae bacterium]